MSHSAGWVQPQKQSGWGVTPAQMQQQANFKGKGKGGMTTPTQGFQPPMKKLRMNEPVGSAAPSFVSGEVRFADATSAQLALQMNGTAFQGATIGVELDETSKDATKIIISGIPVGTHYNLLKEHFSACGVVVFADLKKVGGTPTTGTVRFESAEQAQAALALHGAVIEGHEIALKVHHGSKDNTKLQVFNVPSGLKWEELKAYFMQNGHTPIYAEVMTAPGGSLSAEVRYEDAQHAQLAVQMLNGSNMGGAEIRVAIDPSSSDASKIRASGIAPGLEWQEVKDYFAQCGPVAFVNIDGKGGGKGGMMLGGKGVMGGKGFGGKGCGNNMMGMMQMQMNQMMTQMMQMQKKLMGGGGGVGMGNGGFGGGFGGGVGGMMCGGKGGAKGGQSVASAKGLAEVRFDNPLSAQTAVMNLNGSLCNGAQIQCGFDNTSQDKSKLWVSGLPPGTSWQAVKDHFVTCGQVAFVAVK